MKSYKYKKLIINTKVKSPFSKLRNDGYVQIINNIKSYRTSEIKNIKAINENKNINLLNYVKDLSLDKNITINSFYSYLDDIGKLI